MILNLYATKNKKSGQFGQIKAEVYDAEQIKEVYSVSAIEADEKSKLLLGELELYSIGTYDTCTGVVTSSTEFLLDLGAVINGRKANSEEVK